MQQLQHEKNIYFGSQKAKVLGTYEHIIIEDKMVLYGRGHKKGCSAKGNKETFWRVDKKGIAQAGTYCELTQTFHWRSVVMCKSCQDCGDGPHED